MFALIECLLSLCGATFVREYWGKMFANNKNILKIYHRKSINNGDNVSGFVNICAWQRVQESFKVPEFKVWLCDTVAVVCHTQKHLIHSHQPGSLLSFSLLFDTK